jgi:hypothetical protein
MTAKETITGAMLSIAVVAALYEAHRASSALDLAQALQKQQAVFQQQLQDLQGEREGAVKKLEALREENRSLAVSLAGARKTGEGRAQSQPEINSSNDPEALASSWASAVRRLKERMDQMPLAKIPELQFLDAEEWLDVARHVNLDTDAGFRRALAEVRKRAEGVFAHKFQAALDIYLSANSQWPANVDQLSHYFFPPVDEAILQRWEIVPKTTFPGQNFAGDWVLTEKSPVDPDFDWRWMVDSPTGNQVGPYQVSRENEIEALKESLAPVRKAYMAVNDGKQPENAHDLMGFASGQAQFMLVKRLMQMTETNYGGH